MKRTIITIAVGKKLYVEYACNLALSFLFWNTNNKIEFLLVTDLPELVPDQIKNKIVIKVVKLGDVESGFLSKLYLINFLNDGANLFIDADCLIYGDVSKVFDEFRDHKISAIGYTIKRGLNIAFVKNISKTLNKLNLNYYPIICGSVYYFNAEDKEMVSKFFSYAQQQKLNYAGLGLIKLRNTENEEPLFALSMSKFNCMPISDDGSIKADRMFYDFNKKNILKGKSYLFNKGEPPIPIYSKLSEASPLIIHYNARYTETYEYQSDANRLKLVLLKHFSIKFTEFYVSLVIEWPGRLKQKTAYIIKETFRPFYRRIFGIRKVEKSLRT